MTGSGVSCRFARRHDVGLARASCEEKGRRSRRRRLRAWRQPEQWPQQVSPRMYQARSSGGVIRGVGIFSPRGAESQWRVGDWPLLWGVWHWARSQPWFRADTEASTGAARNPTSPRPTTAHCPVLVTDQAGTRQSSSGQPGRLRSPAPRPIEQDPTPLWTRTRDIGRRPAGRPRRPYSAHR